MFATLNPEHIGVHIDLEDGLDLAKNHGFEGYDFAIAHAWELAQKTSPKAVADLFAQRGLKIGCWNLPFVPYRVDLETWKTELENLKKYAGLAAEMDALRTGMWIISFSDTLDYEENMAFHLERFGPICEILHDHGIRLGIEFLGPETIRNRGKYSFIHTLSGALQLAERMGYGTGLLLDSWHWYASGGTVKELDVLTRDNLVHIHINDAPKGIPRVEQIDNNRRLPKTTGVIDIEGFMGQLKRAGYDGPVTAEPFDQSLNEMPTDEATALYAKTVLKTVNPYK